MPTYTYVCDQCGREEDRLRAMKSRNRTFECFAEIKEAVLRGTGVRQWCQGRMRRGIELPAPAQGDFGTPTRQSTPKARNTYRAQKYMDERLAGKRDSKSGAQIRELGFEPRPASEAITDTRNPDID